MPAKPLRSARTDAFGRGENAMKPAIGWFSLVSFALLSSGGQAAKSQDQAPRVARIPPIEQVQQIVVQLYAVEMSGQTLRQLGLWSDDKDVKKVLSGLPLNDSPLLKDAGAWDSALETAVRLGAVQIISAPKLVTLSGREVEMEILGADFAEQPGNKAGAASTTIKWNVKPTLLKGDKIRFDYGFRRSQTDLTRWVATPAGNKPAERLQQFQSGVDVQLFKPTVLGRLMRYEAVPLPDAKRKPRGSKTASDAPQETTTLLVVTASLIDAKGAQK
jgi:hypothetical protein